MVERQTNIHVNNPQLAKTVNKLTIKMNHYNEEKKQKCALICRKTHSQGTKKSYDRVKLTFWQAKKKKLIFNHRIFNESKHHHSVPIVPRRNGFWHFQLKEFFVLCFRAFRKCKFTVTDVPTNYFHNLTNIQEQKSLNITPFHQDVAELG